MSRRGKTVMRKRVLVTRPQPAAAETAARLAEAGFEPLLLPLSRTVPLAFSMPEARFHALAVTSANAFRHVRREALQSFLALPLFAVGAGTAQAAREAGFADAIDGGGDARHLGDTMRRALPPDARVLYLTGRARQPVFEEHMAAAGIDMTVRDVYDIEPVDYAHDALEQVFGRAPVAAVMLYSGVAAERLAATMAAIEPPFDGKTRFLCISARVAAKLPDAWREKALVAEQPDEIGLFGLFSKL